MNRLLLCNILLCSAVFLHAETRSFQIDDITLYFHLTNLETEQAPYTFQDHVIFTYRTYEPIRGIAVAFAQESFQNRYVFSQSYTKHDLYYAAIPKQLFSSNYIEYQYIVDGVQISDPANPSMKFLQYGTTVSIATLDKQTTQLVAAEQSPAPTTFSIDFANSSSASVQTIFNDTYTVQEKSPSYVSIVGSFNGWEIFFNPLEQPYTQFFTTTIPLPSGTTYYYFFVDGQRILDPDNPNTAFDNIRGHMVSVHKIP